MPSTKKTYNDTFQLIADILSFENSNLDLQLKINSPTVDWDQFVTISSDHLVLTTCYCRLSQKQLLDYLPEGLELYLKEITNINRNRNHSLYKQAMHITNIFNKHKINHTLLKGTALLVGNYFEDLGERMIGDIDILVDGAHIEKAYQLLLNNGYHQTKQTLRAKYFEDKHLPRLIPSNFIGAVEIHKKVLTKSYNRFLETDDILKYKQSKNDVLIPSGEHLLEHSILNFQINDHGHFYNLLNLRSSYDTIVIMNTIKSTSYNIFESHYAQSYISIGKLYFNDFNGLKFNSFRYHLFLKRTANPFLTRVSDFILKKMMLFKLIINRSLLFLKNNNYRKDVFKDYKRIFLLLKSKF